MALSHSEIITEWRLIFKRGAQGCTITHMWPTFERKITLYNIYSSFERVLGWDKAGISAALEHGLWITKVLELQPACLAVRLGPYCSLISRC